MSLDPAGVGTWDYSLAELVKCAEREVAMRKAVYPGRVTAGRMKQETADAEVAKMEEIADRLSGLAMLASGPIPMLDP